MSDVIYKIQAPDGTILRIQGPSGATEADLQQAAEEHYSSIKKQAPAEPVKPLVQEPPQKVASPNPYANPDTVYDPVSGVPMDYGMGQRMGATLMSGSAGMLKPFAGAAQFLGINKPAETLEKVTNMGAQVGGTPAEVADIVGQVASPAPMKMFELAGKIPKFVPQIRGATSKIGSVLDKSVLAKSAAQGAGSAAFTPTSDTGDYADFLTKKAEQMGEGAVLGGVLGKAGQLVFDPKVSAEMKMLKDLGMKHFTPGQLAGQIPVVGGMIQKAEEALTSAPLLGSIIGHGQRIATEDFNRAMGNQVLKPLHETLPKSVSAGQDMINHLYSKINGAYKSLEPKISFGNFIDPKTNSTTINRMMDSSVNITKNLVPEAAQKVDDALKKTFFEPLLEKYSLDGKQFRIAEMSLGEMAKTYISSADPIQRSQGFALREFQEALRNELTKQNPQVGKELREAHEAFKNYLRVEKAAALRGADEAVFSANQMRSAAESMAGRRATARGIGMSVPESQAAVSVMGKGLPDSGTAARLLTPAALGKMLGFGAAEAGGHFLTSGAPLVAAGAMYNKPAMRGLTALATERPAQMRAVAEPVRGGLSQLGGILAAKRERQEE